MPKGTRHSDKISSLFPSQHQKTGTSIFVRYWPRWAFVYSITGVNYLMTCHQLQSWMHSAIHRTEASHYSEHWTALLSTPALSHPSTLIQSQMLSIGYTPSPN
ncbi:hypothetical protein CHS0354_002423 [Potamilus streckersoni]|uniref:Uncharacterized protein n=1 Tax=Potamilus streckersoni TaxID=2493646 RepID=A0AAE0W8X4_9BIVA|nr:hypothetical protein CHS0354_002423 [Potamilus streckersoni]